MSKSYLLYSCCAGVQEPASSSWPRLRQIPRVRLYDYALAKHAHSLRQGFSTSVLFINPRRACAARVTVVGSVCPVCLSVTLYLTSRMSVHLKNDTVYLTGNEGQKL